jgi:hypothetical protein
MHLQQLKLKHQRPQHHQHLLQQLQLLKLIYQELLSEIKIQIFKKIQEDFLAPQELGFACQFDELNSQTVLLEGL